MKFLSTNWTALGITMWDYVEDWILIILFQATFW
jgi:hypothetical protein